VSEPFALPSAFAWSEGQIAIDLPGGHALFTTRAGGDLAAEPGGSDALRRAVGPDPERWAQDHQVHGTVVRVIAPSEPVLPLAGEADGSATTRRDVACLVRAADCVPVALVAPEGVAALHGGWRGLAAGILEEGVRTMRALGATEIRAAVGPHARACCYEAGDEVHGAFAHLGPQVRRGDNADLEAITRALLERAGVEQVHAVGACTICSPEGTFWSFRRQGELAGRQGAVVWRS
jgi:YfiH family protein